MIDCLQQTALDGIDKWVSRIWGENKKRITANVSNKGRVRDYGHILGLSSAFFSFEKFESSFHSNSTKEYSEEHLFVFFI
jgi:hypothetical protein